MNILFLTLSQINDISSRGIYTDLIRKFVKEGHSVYIVIPFERNTGRRTELFDSRGAKILGVKALNIQQAGVIEKGLGTLLLETQYMSAIKKYLKGVRFDLVLYSTPPITFNKVIKWAKNTYGAKSYLLLKDIFPQNAVDLGLFKKNSFVYKLFRKKEEVLYAISDHIGCMSPANCQYVIDNNPTVDSQIVEVCPNSIEITDDKQLTKDDDLSIIDYQLSIKKKYGVPTDKTICIYGGNLGKPQGIDFLMETIKSNENRKDSFFLIAGSGTEFNRLNKWFEENRPQNAKLLKALPKAEYDVLMSSADIGMIFLDKRFTIPNYPSRLLSYLENKIPIMMAVDVNTDIGTIAETNGYGYWVSSGDLIKFDEKLNQILADKNLRLAMGECGYQFLLNNYSVEHTYATIMKHFK